MIGGGSWYPLSHTQEALWFLWKLAPESWAYNLVVPVGVRGDLDVSALERTVERLVDRHPCLRTQFKELEGRPVQRTSKGQGGGIDQVDASTWTEERLGDAARQRAQQPFDLEADAGLRVVLYCRSSDHHLLLFIVHHIVSDLWSLIVLMDELRQVYQVYVTEKAGVEIALPTLSASYEDHVRWQRKMVAGEQGERAWRYWRSELAGELPVLDLPADRSRPAMQSFRGGTVMRVINVALTQRLKQLAAGEGGTLYMVLLAAFQVLLHRYTGQDDLIVGTPAAGRNQPGFDDVFGDFVNMVPLRTNLSGNPTFRETFRQVRGKVVHAIEHQDYPFSLMVDGLHPARDLSRSPIFQVSFVLQKFHRFAELTRSILPADDEPDIPFGDLVLEPWPLHQQDGQFDLSLEMKQDENGRVVAAWKFAADLFEEDSIARMAARFETLLHSIAESPKRALAELPLLTEAERRTVITDGDGARKALPEVESVCALFEAQSKQQPEATAVRCGSQAVTYGVLAKHVEGLASILVGCGVGRNVIVGLLLPRGFELVTAMLAVSKAGGAFLPLDPRHPTVRLGAILESSSAAVVLTARALVDTVEPAVEHVPLPTRPRLLVLDDLVPRPTDGSWPMVDGGDLAYVMYTSGSTGKPKGVMVEHRGMVNHVLAKLADLGMGKNDALAQNGPQSFDIVVWQCLAPLVMGGRVEVLQDECAEDPAALVVAIAEQGVSVLQVVPSMLLAILDEVATCEGGPPPLTGLRWMVPTGEALPTELCRRWLDVYPEIPVLNTYGSTECSDDQCHYVMEHLTPTDEAVAVASIGTPIHNMATYVLDETLAPVPVGVVGELYLGGIGVGRGYLGDAKRTAVAFVPDPFSGVAGARIYRTRDLSRRRADGNLDFLGRVDHMIKLRGFRIEPGEIETALVRHPEIGAAAVLARNHPSGERRLVGYIVPSNEAKDGLPASETLRAFLADHLPQYLVPTVFCPLEAMPLTANGKLDQRALPAPEWRASSSRPFVAPSTVVEETIAEIWGEALGLDQVGATEDFFAIGGDSILSIQVVSRCKRAGLQLRPSDLFLQPTVAGLAALADRNEQDGASHQPVVSPAQLVVSPEQLQVALGQVTFDDD